MIAGLTTAVMTGSSLLNKPQELPPPGYRAVHIAQHFAKGALQVVQRRYGEASREGQTERLPSLSAEIQRLTKSVAKKERQLQKILGLIPAQPQATTQAIEPLKLDIPTASYLEVEEQLAMERQKALVKNISRQGIVSEQEGREMALVEEEKPIDFTLITIIAILFLGLKIWT